MHGLNEELGIDIDGRNILFVRMCVMRYDSVLHSSTRIIFMKKLQELLEDEYHMILNC